MGWFDSADETKQKEITKEVKAKIAKDGLANQIADKDLMRVIIEQNNALIGLTAANCIANSGLAGDAVAVIHTNLYYNSLQQYLKK
jgi:ferritin-like metal-binding protein YciE